MFLALSALLSDSCLSMYLCIRLKESKPTYAQLYFLISSQTPQYTHAHLERIHIIRWRENEIRVGQECQTHSDKTHIHTLNNIRHKARANHSYSPCVHMYIREKHQFTFIFSTLNTQYAFCYILCVRPSPLHSVWTYSHFSSSLCFSFTQTKIYRHSTIEFCNISPHPLLWKQCKFVILTFHDFRNSISAINIYINSPCLKS